MTVYYDDGTCAIHLGDCRELLPGLRVDVIVTDPPYGLAFMGKAWDQVDQQFHQAWATAALEALPPGGWLTAFGGTRTWHRLACGIEDAGFEIRDTLMWLYGQGWPKSRATLKPGWEPILLARKPGSSVLQIDASRVGNDTSRGDRYNGKPSQPSAGANGYRMHKEIPWEVPVGRWPANVALTHGEGCQQAGVRKVKVAGWHRNAPDGNKFSGATYAQDAYTLNMPQKRDQSIYGDEDGIETMEAWECAPGCPVALLDQQSGTLSTHGTDPGGYERADKTDWRFRKGAQVGDKGGASRFFYTAKAGRSERVTVDGEGHPTVKPLALMRWLVRLVTSPGGTVLDPFCGSGSTLVAAALEGRRGVGVEAEERYCEMAAQRYRDRPPVQEVLAL